jgi:hypothetical protein
LADLSGRLQESDACARLALQERDQERRRATDLTAQLKHAARFAAALEVSPELHGERVQEPALVVSECSARTVCQSRVN